MAKSGGGSGVISVSNARYAKGKVAVSVSNTGDWSNRQQLLARGVGGKWSSRERAYIMSPAQAGRLRKLAKRGYSYNPIAEQFYTRGDKAVSRAEVNKIR